MDKLQSFLIGVTIALVTWRIFIPVEHCFALSTQVSITRRWMPWDDACPSRWAPSVDLAATVFQVGVLVSMAVVLWLVLPKRETLDLVSRRITGSRVPTKVQGEGGAAEIASVSMPRDFSLETVRLADLGSRRIWNKGLSDLIDDFEKYAGGVPRDLVSTLATIGRLISDGRLSGRENP